MYFRRPRDRGARSPRRGRSLVPLAPASGCAPIRRPQPRFEIPVERRPSGSRGSTTICRGLTAGVVGGDGHDAVMPTCAAAAARRRRRTGLGGSGVGGRLHVRSGIRTHRRGGGARAGAAGSGGRHASTRPVVRGPGVRPRAPWDLGAVSRLLHGEWRGTRCGLGRCTRGLERTPEAEGAGSLLDLAGETTRCDPDGQRSAAGGCAGYGRTTSTPAQTWTGSRSRSTGPGARDARSSPTGGASRDAAPLPTPVDRWARAAPSSSGHDVAIDRAVLDSCSSRPSATETNEGGSRRSPPAAPRRAGVAESGSGRSTCPARERPRGSAGTHRDRRTDTRSWRLWSHAESSSPAIRHATALAQRPNGSRRPRLADWSRARHRRRRPATRGGGARARRGADDGVGGPATRPS